MSAPSACRSNAIYDAQFGNATRRGAGSDQRRLQSGFGYTCPTLRCRQTQQLRVDSAGKFGCDIGSVASPSFGRFYPDHYEASLGVTQGCSADGFSYMGQPFSMTSASAGSMQIKALAAGQTFATAPGLPSYTGAYTPLASVWFGAQNGVGSTTDLIRCVSSTQNATANRCVATTLPYKAAASNAWTAGSFTVAPTTYYFDPPKDATTTPDSTWGPYDSLSVGVTVSDSDGSTLTIPAGQSFVLNGDTYQSVNGSLPMKMRYGRMRIQNASGSEQVPIVVPVLLEYWSGSAWMPNLLDATCTRLLGPPPTAYGGNTAAAACYGGAPASGAQCTSTTAGGVGSIYTTQLRQRAGQLRRADLQRRDVLLRAAQRDAGSAQGERDARRVGPGAGVAQDRSDQPDRRQPFRHRALQQLQQPLHLPAGKLLTGTRAFAAQCGCRSPRPAEIIPCREARNPERTGAKIGGKPFV